MTRLLGRGSSLWSSLLAFPNVRPLSYERAGARATGVQYSYPVIPGVKPLPYQWGLGGGKNPSPFLLVTLARNLTFVAHSWEGGMLESCPFWGNTESLDWGLKREGALPSSAGKEGGSECVMAQMPWDCHSSYQDLVDFLK